MIKKCRKENLINHMKKAKSSESYIIIEKVPIKSYEIFLELIRHEFFGLLISRTYPGKIRRDYTIPEIPVFWLSRAEHGVNPSNLKRLNPIIRNLIENAASTVILFDGFEYLMVQIGFAEALNWMLNLRKIMERSSTQLIIPLSSSTLSPEECDLLENEFLSIHLIEDFQTRLIQLWRQRNPKNFFRNLIDSQKKRGD